MSHYIIYFRQEWLPFQGNGYSTSTVTMDTAFRKIDIDAYDEDIFLESELFEPDPRSPAQVLSDAKQKGTTVRSSLAK